MKKKGDLEQVLRDFEENQTLREAITDRRYDDLMTLLEGSKRCFLGCCAYTICSKVISNGCPLKVFQSLLAHCPPLKDFINYDAVGNYLYTASAAGSSGTGGLLQEAAYWDNAPVLEYILEQGFSPNASRSGECSVLEAALWGGCPAVLELLVRREDVDFTVTEQILDAWSGLGQEAGLDACFRIVAPRLLGEAWDANAGELPILPGMTVLHAANRLNWALTERLCRETDVTVRQGKYVLERFMQHNTTLPLSACAGLLHALFTACPGLLRCQYPRYILVLCVLSGEEDICAMLAPWVEQMPGKQVVLCGKRLGEAEYDIVDCLSRWEARIGPRLRPILRREDLLPVRMMAFTPDETVRTLLKQCEIRGRPPKRGVSRLAMDVLHMISPELLAELLEAGILFSQEDFDALLDYCQAYVRPYTEEKRNVLLGYGQKQVDYEL